MNKVDLLIKSSFYDELNAKDFVLDREIGDAARDMRNAAIRENPLGDPGEQFSGGPGDDFARILQEAYQRDTGRNMAEDWESIPEHAPDVGVEGTAGVLNVSYGTHGGGVGLDVKPDIGAGVYVDFVSKKDTIVHTAHYGFRYLGLRAHITESGNYAFGFNLGVGLNPFPYGYSYNLNLDDARLNSGE